MVDRVVVAVLIVAGLLLIFTGALASGLFLALIGLAQGVLSLGTRYSYEETEIRRHSKPDDAPSERERDSGGGNKAENESNSESDRSRQQLGDRRARLLGHAPAGLAGPQQAVAQLGLPPRASGPIRAGRAGPRASPGRTA